MKRLGMVVIAVCLILFSTCLFAQETNVIRNGSFTSGMQDWNIFPDVMKASPDWNPLTDGKVSLHPPTSGYKGVVLYQNLNVTGVGGKTLTLSMNLTNSYMMSSGKTVAVYVAYATSDGIPEPVGQIRVGSWDNASIPSTGTVVTGSVTLPPNARKLAGLMIAKEDSGEFLADDIALTVDGVTVGAIPAVTDLSATSGVYGSQVTITGTGFGAGTMPQGNKVFLDGTAAGIAVNSWTDTQISVTVNTPCEGGKVQVMNDFTMSDVTDKVFEVTSPFFTVNVLQPPQGRIPKGQTAEYVLKIDFKNGFTTQNGLTLTSPMLSGITQFTPVPVKAPGGVVMKVDTTTLMGVGPLPFEIQAMDGVPPSANVHTAKANLEVYQVESVRFLDGGTYVTEKTITNQGNFYVSTEVKAVGGAVEYPKVKIESSDPTRLLVVEDMWGPSFYALQNGQVTLTATAPGNITGTVLVNINFPTSPSVISASVTPSPITNKHTDPVYFFAQATDRMSYQTYGNISIYEDTRDWTDTTGYTTVAGTFKVDHSATDLGTYLFGGQVCLPGDTWCSGGSMVAPLTIVNDPTYSAAKGKTYSIDPALPPYSMEHFVIELYDDQLTKVYSRELFSYQMHYGDGPFSAAAIPPGTYKVRIAPPAGATNTFLPQWYPNAEEASGAAPLTFSAGQTTENLYFFLRAAPVSDTFSIFGRVTAGGSGLGGVTITLSGAATGTITTDLMGNYAFNNLSNGTYVLTPSMSGQTFDPVTRSVNIAGYNMSGQDFTAAAPTYSVSGNVSFNAMPLSGVTITLAGPGGTTTTTDTGGNYIFTGLVSGAYTVTPSMSGYTFTPQSRSIPSLIASVIGEDFTAAQAPVYSITGVVRDLATQQGIAGATVTAKNAGNDSVAGTTTTDGSGNFNVGVPGPGQYYVLAVKSGYEQESPPDLIDVSGTTPPATMVSMTATGPTLTIQLNQGWNFISLPVQPANTEATAVLAGILNNVLIVWGWDNQQQQWLSFRPNITPSFVMESGKGYWIFMDQAASLNLAGDPGPTTIYLYEGWNLVGYNGSDNTPLTGALSSISQKWSIIWGWENGQWKAAHATIFNLPVPALDSLSSYKAYWIKIKPGGTGAWVQ